MKKIRLIQGLSFALFLSLTACTPAKYKTYIVGNWRPAVLESVDSKHYSLTPDSATNQFTGIAHAFDPIKQSLLDSNKTRITVEDFMEQIQAVTAETRTMYTFSSNGTGTRVVPDGISMRGTWKLKKRGKLLVLTNPDITQPFKLTIDTLTSTRMVVRNPYMPQGMRLTYIKQ
ncbi:MAG: hypothetical protein ABIK52_06535 [Bacteroidota bacterium]